MNTAYLKKILITLLSAWTLVVAFLVIYDYKETEHTAINIANSESFDHLSTDSGIMQCAAIHQKRNLIIMGSIWLMGLIGLYFGFYLLKKQYRTHLSKEDLFKSSEEKFRRYFEDNLAIMLFVNPITKSISDVNQAAINYYGYSRAEFLNLSMYDINALPPSEIDQKMKEAIMQKANHLSFKHKLADDQLRDVEVYASPFMFEGNMMMSVIVHDVTDQKSAERALRKSKIKHQEISRLLETLFDAVPDVIGIQDSDHNMIRYNKAGYELLNKTHEEVKGKKCYELIGCKLPCRDCATSEVYRTKKPAVLEKLDKKLNVWMEVRAYPILNEEGEIIQVIEHLRDISDRKMFIDELRNAKEKAEESDRLKSAFLANMSHEIRTPMNAILGFTQLLKRNKLEEEHKSEYIDIIQNSGNHLLDIINDIIDISKIDAKQMGLMDSEIDLHLVLMEIYQIFQSEVEQKLGNEVSFNLNIDPTINELFILVDKTRLKQILINLIGNAVKFTKKGEIEFGYSIKNDSTILFSIKDTGIGMNDSELQFVFDRFRQGDENYNRTYGGTGLGLSISKEFVDLMGGRLWAESSKGIGSTFYFTIPLKRVRSAFMEEKVEQVEKINKVLRGTTILIVEDEQYSMLILEELLKPLGVIILKAYDGIEAIKTYIDHTEIGLILMDIQLPLLDGLQVTQRIKKINPDIPIIAQTANAMREDKQKALAAGCNDYISKPIDSDELFRLIKRYLI